MLVPCGNAVATHSPVRVERTPLIGWSCRCAAEISPAAETIPLENRSANQVDVRILFFPGWDGPPRAHAASTNFFRKMRTGWRPLDGMEAPGRDALFR
jgi:hypothetical protein